VLDSLRATSGGIWAHARKPAPHSEPPSASDSVAIPEDHGPESQDHDVSISGQLQYQRVSAEYLVRPVASSEQVQVDRGIEVLRPHLQPGGLDADGGHDRPEDVKLWRGDHVRSPGQGAGRA